MSKVKEALQAKGVSIYRLAKDLGIHYSDIHGAVNGNKPFHPKYKQKVSEYLGIEEKELFEEE